MYMKNKQKGFIVPIIIGIIALIIVGGGIYFYSNQKNKVVSPISNEIVSTSTPINTENLKTNSLTDAQFVKAVGDPEAKVVARGDINRDGYEDAIIEQMSCGASCGFSLQVAFNLNNTSVKLLKAQKGYQQFEPAYVGSSAIKSSVTNISIKNGIISLTGKGLRFSIEEWIVSKRIVTFVCYLLSCWNTALRFFIPSTTSIF